MKEIFKFILKRIITGMGTLFIIISITFLLLHKLPGDPFQSDKGIPPQIKANLVKKYELDKPLINQYIKYLKNLLHGDLGISMSEKGKTINKIIKRNFPVSLDLGIRAIIFGLSIGFPLGIIAALNKNKRIDKMIMFVSILGISVPSFVIAGLLQLYAVDVHKTILIDKLHFPLGKIFITGWDSPHKKILPVISLGLFIVAMITRILRNKMIEIMEQDYIKLAIAKGVSPFNIVLKHALKNAILPIITILSPTIAAILTGSFVVEAMFGIPGLGKYYITSITNRDYTMVLGITIFYAVFLIVMMIVMDIIYALVDPKIKLEGENE